MIGIVRSALFNFNFLRIETVILCLTCFGFVCESSIVSVHLDHEVSTKLKHGLTSTPVLVGVLELLVVLVVLEVLVIRIAQVGILSLRDAVRTTPFGHCAIWGSSL